MPGAGTNPVITTSSSRPICLDVTRLVRRTGRHHTGVDRVEWAYLQWVLTREHPVFGLMRSAFGYILLDRAGLQVLVERVREANWDRPSALSRLALKLPPARRGAETTLRRNALARATPSRLLSMLTRHLPADALYLNVGHSNLTRRVLGAMRHMPDVTCAVLIHDLIPLTHPDMQRPGTVRRFARKMQVVSELADGLICNSRDTRRKVEQHFAMLGRVPPAMVAYLGTQVPAAPEPAPPVPHPYVICVGTIEPRKNHALLLDLWDSDTDGRLPHLVMCGARGWNNDAVFARLDRMHPPNGKVHEFNDLSDGQMISLVSGAQAALFPSLAEGFGLPQFEAAQLGITLICGDLDIYHELLGDLPVYASLDDPYSWKQAILEILHADRTDRTRAEHPSAAFSPPNWESHFNLVLKQFG